MSDRMKPIPFSNLIYWILKEKAESGSVFGVKRPFQKESKKQLNLFDGSCEIPFGPAAGPATQLAQNIIAAYYAGSRFFELKTVQILDGEDLPVSKPCILAEDECYNCEWSTELRVPDAMNEYIKAWFALKILSKEFHLGQADGFIFNMSVGYDYEGIRSHKIDSFIEGLKDASGTAIWKECKNYLLQNLQLFQEIDADFIEQISSQVCLSATVSTLHGCPPAEIEKIASYLITEKGLHTFVKCNPTLLGYEFARKTMDQMGYDYVAFGDFHFRDDLQYQDAVPMFERLIGKAQEHNLEFGVKITNTFPVDVKSKELPSEEMYMSGRSLFPLSISLASRLSKDFHGKLKISYSGGADAFNIAKIFKTGIWPITVATTVLKPGGYQRMTQLAEELEAVEWTTSTLIDVDAVAALAESALTDLHHLKSLKPLPSRKMKKKVPLTDCFIAPCQEACPIQQDIPAYVALVGEGRHLEALKLITSKNPLPFITGTICNHRCMSKCTRNFYEESVHIRAVKLEAAEKSFQTMMAEFKKPARTSFAKVAIVGGGPAGLSAAYFLRKKGIQATIFERKNSLGGIVRHIIPEFRITSEAIDRDIQLIQEMGVEVKLNTEITSISQLKKQGYEYIILANGAWKHPEIKLAGNSNQVLDVLDFLEKFKESPVSLKLGKNIVVIGGGNTAMDAARAAKLVPGAEQVSLVYRRTKKYMPADEEELQLALKYGVIFEELLAPISLEDAYLNCRKMKLGEADTSGRRIAVETDEVVKIQADTVIYAIGEQVDTNFLKENGIILDPKGLVKTNIEKVYAVGDAMRGPATVVEAIADATRCAEMIVEEEEEFTKTVFHGFHHEEKDIYSKRGILAIPGTAAQESNRCLECSTVCESCADVCPNRANIAIEVDGNPIHQIIHVDGMCNECGNCATFCPYDSKPYKDKFTLFSTEADFVDSKNQGFLILDQASRTCRVRLEDRVGDIVLGEKACFVPEEIQAIMLAVITKYSYLFY